MNVKDLGDKKKRVDLIEGSTNSNSADKIWIQETKNGETIYVQFTHHTFYYQGRLVKIAIAHDVSKQIEQKETRRVHFPKFITHESNLPLAAAEWDADMEVRNWSDKAEELFEWSEEEVVGRANFLEKLIIDEELQNIKANISQAIQNKDSYYSFESKVNTKNGKTLICKWHNSLIYDHKDELYSIHSLITDISQRKQSENLFRALSEESLVGVYLIQDGKFKYVNPRFAEIFGYERDRIVDNFSFKDLTHPEFEETVRENIAEPVNGDDDSKEYDFLCLTKEGQTIHVNVYGSTIAYKGKPAIIGTLIDITDKQETIQKYEASVKSFQDLFDSISDAIYIQDEEGKILEVNKGAVDMFGYEQSYFIGDKPNILAAPGKVNFENTQERVKKALEGESQSFKWWGKRKNGEVFPIEMVANPGTYFGQNVLITIARDISERFEAEEQLRKNEEMFRQLFQNSPIPIVLMDKRQEIQQINEAFNETFGYETDEIKGLNIDKLLVPDEELEIGREISNRIFEGKTAHHFGKRLRKDGSLADVLIYGVPVIVDDKTVAIFGIYIDITDRKKAEEKIKNSLKEKEILLAENHNLSLINR
jgi:PAS domain S-box-containing protein